MHLLTHDETGAASVARAGGVALARRTGAAGKTAPAGSRSPWRRIRRILYVLLGLAVVGPLLAFVIGWIIFPVPKADATAITQVATFTFNDGETPVATVKPKNINRVLISLNQVPEHVREAVLSAEDRSFYSNPGFDIAGIGRAVYNQLTGGVGGGSTITQQYIKVSTGQDDISLLRKYKEVVLSVKISREQTKDEILTNYLNTIYFGRGAYGIQAAAQAYFGKDAQELSVTEGAMLAGVIQSPSRWDPEQNLERSKERWGFVLQGMEEQGWLSPAERAQQSFPDNWKPASTQEGGVPSDPNYYIYKKARAELAAVGITEEQINTAGLTVTTTIDPESQAGAVKAIADKTKDQPPNLRYALVAVEPKTGAVVAYYGGAYSYGATGPGLDYASEGLRPPGSSFKPFVFAAALEGTDGVGLGTVFDGSSPQKFNGGSGGRPVEVRNAEGNCGQCNVKTAMTDSVNTVFYKMGLDVGISKVIETARKAGIPEDVELEARGGITLGDQGVHPIDMAAAFSTFAADGERREPYIVSRVVSADGRVLHERGETPGERVFSEQVARNVTESMLDVPTKSKFALAGGRPVAAKTGTQQLEGSANDNKDAWTVGYTPQLATAVWVGTDVSDPIRDKSGKPIFGSTLPGPIFKQFMDDALRDKPTEQFSPLVPMGKAIATEVARESRPLERLPGGDQDDQDGQDGEDDRDDQDERDRNSNDYDRDRNSNNNNNSDANRDRDGNENGNDDNGSNDNNGNGNGNGNNNGNNNDDDDRDD